MKNLFKNLMLVAVAAMAFTACQKDNGEMDSVKRVVEFTANIGDDTRSGFAEKEEGATAYKSKWDGGEMFMLIAESTSAYPQIDAEGKFSVTFNENDHYADIYSPAASWEYKYTTSWGYTPVIPATQTPRANSVDPAAHILSAIDVPVDGSENIAFSFEHAVAYGKMTVNTPADFEIAKVVINLAGVDKDLTYTINATNVKNNTFWFATEALEVSKMTVKAYNAVGDIMAKSVDVEAGKLSFANGRVSTFSVSNLVEEEAPAAPVFTNETTYFYNDGNYSDVLLIFSSEELGTLQLNFYGALDGNFITPGTYTLGEEVYIGSSTSYSYYEPESTRYKLSSGSVIVTFTEDMKYHFEFVDIVYADSYYSVVGTLNSTYTGDVEGFGMPDNRTKLAVPTGNAPVVNGKDVTLSWGAVEGADSYYIYCAYDDTISASTTETSVTFTMPAYSTYYYFHIQAIANEDNDKYRSSDEGTLQGFNTGKDPNVLADVMLSAPTADTYSTHGFCFKLAYADGSGYYFRFFFNEADRPGDNSLNPGVYTGIGDGSNDAYAPGAGRFAATMFDSWGRVSGYYARAFTESSTIEVTYANDEYTIILNHNGRTYGYKGMPDGWVAPSSDDNNGEGGGEEPENPGEGGGEEPENPGEGGGDTSEWNFNVGYNGVMYARYTYFTFTETDGDQITAGFVYPSKAAIPGTYEVSSSLTTLDATDYKISEIKINGVFASSASGNVVISANADGTYTFALDLVINGKSYKGSAIFG